MKFNKIQLQNPSVTEKQLQDKLNELIDFLNHSFITQDADTGLANLHTLTIDSNFINDNNIELSDVTVSSIYDDIRCPKCGKSYFTVGPTVSTCVYYPPIIKDGVNINPDHNIHRTSYTCCECGHSWEE